MIVKQSVGIDVSKDSIECSIGIVDGKQNISISKSKTFKNSVKGFEKLCKWVEDKRAPIELIYVMEATGVYYENLAYWLARKNKKVCVLLPNKMKHFVQSLNVKTKTDSVDAKMISRIGLERKLEFWQLPSPLMKEIKFLSREYRESKAKLTVTKNQIHAKNHSYNCPDKVIERLNRQVDLLDAQLDEIEDELRVMVKSDTNLYERLNRLTTIPGVRFMTAVTILAETNGFALVRNVKQLVSYAGLDVQHNQSGNKEGKSKISKKGNHHIRNALYMPAICCGVHNPQLKKFYNNLVARKPAKKIAVAAVMRKLLILTYVLWKNETEYNPNHEKEKRNKERGTKKTSGNQEAKPLLRHKSKALKKEVGELINSPTQDELPYNQSTKALLRQQQS